MLVTGVWDGFELSLRYGIHMDTANGHQLLTLHGIAVDERFTL